jgi:hypothetical protein
MHRFLGKELSFKAGLQGHSSNVDGVRENFSCRSDQGENFLDGSVEINGSSMPAEWSIAQRNRCNRTGKQ